MFRRFIMLPQSGRPLSSMASYRKAVSAGALELFRASASGPVFDPARGASSTDAEPCSRLAAMSLRRVAPAVMTITVGFIVSMWSLRQLCSRLRKYRNASSVSADSAAPLPLLDLPPCDGGPGHSGGSE
uniref:Uncharacterized protein n=1 Tax=Anopheles merus TaxID=30066 RepID=A0A182VE82_ANOME